MSHAQDTQDTQDKGLRLLLTCTATAIGGIVGVISPGCSPFINGIIGSGSGCALAFGGMALHDRLCQGPSEEEVELLAHHDQRPKQHTPMA